MSTAREAASAARRKVRFAVRRVEDALLALEDGQAKPDLIKAEADLDAAILAAAEALEALRTEQRQTGGLLL